MCGIAGILQYGSRPALSGTALSESLPGVRASTSEMVQVLRHRGPDGVGVEVLGARAAHSNDRRSASGCLGLGHTRLAILDLSAAGAQPMQERTTGDWLTFNGEIYNFRELRDELGAEAGGTGHSAGAWRSRTDTEVILKAYARWGRECVHHLRGMFAFALWDARKQELFLARDRFGIKPLYYFAGDGFFVFASEVGALLATGLVPRQLDGVGLWQYLGYQTVPAPRTLIQDVRMLLPGHWLVVRSDGSTTQHRYWDLLERASPEASTASRAAGRQRTRELLLEAVTLHLVSDVPVATFLSGGIDSTALVALLSEEGLASETFSVRLGEDAYDETRFAREAAARFGTRHTEVLLKQPDLLDELPDALRAMDQPSGDGVNTYVVARAVSAAGIKVALSGLGGDELFAGYPSFARLERLVRMGAIWERTPAAARALAARCVRGVGRSSIRAQKTAALLASDGDLASLLPITREVLSATQRRGLLQDPWIQAASGSPDPYVALLRTAFASNPSADTLARISYGESRTYMHDLLLRDTDQMSMAHSLEVRVPFLDHKLAEYVIGLPAAYKRPHGIPKPLLVESVGGVLPDSIVHRPKQGFVLPFEPWMRGPLREYCADRLGPKRLGSRGIFRPQALQALWGAFLGGHHGVSWSRLWLLVALEEWLEREDIRGG